MATTVMADPRIGVREAGGALDPLNPEAGESLTTTRVAYEHHGVLLANAVLRESGATRVRHVFRYDLSPLFARLHNEGKHVPVVGPDSHVRFVDAPRRYDVPVKVRVRYDDQSHEEKAVIVLDKRGLRRIDRNVGPTREDEIPD
jgi:hypothetical protein